MNSFTDNFTINGITLTAQPICRQSEVLTPDALAFVAELHKATAGRRQELLQARRDTPRADRQGPGPAVPPRDRVRPQRPELARRSPGPGPGGPPRGDHRPGGQEDDHQRAELRRQGVARGHGGLHHPDLAQRHPGPAEPHGCAGAPDRLHHPRGQGVQAPPGRGAAHDRGPSPRLAPAGEAHAHRRHAGRRRHRRLRPVLLPQRPPPDRPGQGPVLLPAEDREPPRGPAVERHLHPGPGPARHPAGHHPRHRADRDHHRRVRDGGDPLRTARPLRRPERRPLGLHLLPDQELPHPRPAVRPAGPRPGHHDRAVHARLHRTARPGLPQARRHGDRRDGRVRPQPQGRRTPTPTPSRRSAPTRPARPATASTAPGWRTRTWFRSAARCSTPCSATARTSWTASARTSPRTTAPCSTSPPPPAPSPSRASGTTSRSGIRYIESWLRGNGAVAIHNLMEDAATAEISRSQLWQWIFSRAITDHGDVITREWVEDMLDEEFARLERFEGDRFADARDIFEEVTLSADVPGVPDAAGLRPLPARSARRRRRPRRGSRTRPA